MVLIFQTNHTICGFWTARLSMKPCYGARARLEQWPKYLLASLVGGDQTCNNQEIEYSQRHMMEGQPLWGRNSGSVATLFCQKNGLKQCGSWYLSRFRSALATGFVCVAKRVWRIWQDYHFPTTSSFQLISPWQSSCKRSDVRANPRGWRIMFGTGPNLAVFVCAQDEQIGEVDSFWMGILKQTS